VRLSDSWTFTWVQILAAAKVLPPETTKRTPLDYETRALVYFPSQTPTANTFKAGRLFQVELQKFLRSRPPPPATVAPAKRTATIVHLRQEVEKKSTFAIRCVVPT
jgi:hypothetical protein